jgi:hypothetical protein
MKSNLAEHQEAVNWEIVRKQDMEDIINWLDEDVDSYMQFLAWRQIRDAYTKAETDWANNQDTSYETEMD